MTVYKLTGDDAAAAEQKVITGARKDEGPMDAKELQRIMYGLVTDATNLVDAELSPERARATDYYRGQPFGNEDPGRSQFVVTEVRDAIHGMLPSMLRPFFSGERVVELVARTAQGVEAAKQATDYVNYVIAEDNQGFLRAYDVIKDGMVRKIGVFKYWWDESTRRAYREENVSQDVMELLVANDDVNVTSHTENKDGTSNIEYTVKGNGKPKIETVPPEEFLFDREARTLDQALFVAHRTHVARGDLIAMGYDADEIDEHGGPSASLEFNAEAVERQESTAPRIGHESDAGEANDKILYIEAYPYLDLNGDGEEELVQICMIGPSYHVVHSEPVDERPFALFCPIPEPHTLLGQSVADLTMDIQLTKSSVVRSMFDSLALSIYPRTAFVEGMASVEDILNTEIGAPIRMRKEGAVQPFVHPFTGEGAMPIVQWLDGVTESRIGRDKGAMGLDADALQSTTQQGVGAAVAAAQEQVELMCRVFAEQTWKPLVKGIYGLLVKHRPAARLVRLRGTYVSIDTTGWDADMDVVVNVALGASDTSKKIAALSAIAAKQEQILQMLGPDNPLVSLPQLRETYSRIIELSGFRDVSAFLKPIDPNWAPPAPAQQAPPPPSPAQVQAQANIQMEQMRVEKELQIKQVELTLKRQQQDFDQRIALMKAAHDYTLRRYQIDAQFHANYTEANLAADAANEAAALDGHLAIRKQTHLEHDSARKHALAVAKHEHDTQMDTLAAAQEDAAPTDAPTDGTE